MKKYDPTKDKRFVKAVRNVCPRPGGGITSITFSSTIDGKEESVTLTAADRAKFDEAYRKLKGKP